MDIGGAAFLTLVLIASEYAKNAKFGDLSISFG